MVKYQEGFIYIAGYGGEFWVLPSELRADGLTVSTPAVIPKPHQLWTKQHERSVFPLLMIMSFAWALEM